MIEDEELQAQLAYIKVNFEFVVDLKKHIFKDLLKTGTSIGEVLPVLKDIEEVLKKITAVSNGNTGLKMIVQINSVINGEVDSKLPGNIEVNNVESFRWAPLVSAEAERSFSSFEALFRDSRRRLLPDNLKKTLGSPMLLQLNVFLFIFLVFFNKCLFFAFLSVLFCLFPIF